MHALHLYLGFCRCGFSAGGVGGPVVTPAARRYCPKLCCAATHMWRMSAANGHIVGARKRCLSIFSASFALISDTLGSRNMSGFFHDIEARDCSAGSMANHRGLTFFPLASKIAIPCLTQRWCDISGFTRVGLVRGGAVPQEVASLSGLRGHSSRSDFFLTRHHACNATQRR